MDGKNIFKLVIGVLIVYVLLRMIMSKYADPIKPAAVENYIEEFADYDPQEMEREEGFVQPGPAGMGSTMGPMAVSADLLPKPVGGSTDFGEFAPKNLGQQNFLDAAKFIGIDTQGSSLRNATYDLRRPPAIPKTNVGPWNNSTLEADLYRRPLDC